MNAEDRQAILDLISRYSHSYDANDMEGFAALFDKDAVLTSPRLGMKTTSSAQICQAMAARRQMLAEQGIQPRHYQTNTLLTENAEGHVRGRTMILVTWQHAGEPEPKVMHTGVYEEEFRKTGEGWKFSKRDLLIDHD